MKKRILIIVGSLGMRGASRSLAETLDLRLCRDFECVIALPQGDGPFLASIEKMDVTIIRAQQPYWVTRNDVDHWLYGMRQIPEAVRQLRTQIRALKVDLVFTNCGLTPVGALAANEEGLPHVWYLRECFKNPATGLRFYPGQSVLAKVVSETSSRLMVVSNAVREEYLAYAESTPIHVIPSSINVQQYFCERLAKDFFRILSVGTTSQGKGLDDLVEAARLLQQSKMDFIINVLGSFDDKHYERTIRARLVKYDLEDVIQLHGWREDSKDWYAHSDMLCCPSHAESFGRSVVEGMASGLPVVATRCGGPDELVLDGVTGYLVPSQNPRLLADSIRSLINDPERGISMGRAGRYRAQSLYDIQHSAHEWSRALQETLTSSPATSGSGILELLLNVLDEAKPRMLLGRKYWLVSRLAHYIGRPIVGE